MEELKGMIIFAPKYRRQEALRGLEGFSHIWLIWGFLQEEGKDWSPTVRPPRLGG
ncbi:TrmO family methyltransferase domain-containing protein, partial [Acinetobacter baumannii]|uniref:TrmO family methyltransferase domain-containing protein n=1 Tax=Acinetobacter baumannii TaxID=470 RepID=UPI0031F35CB9